MEAEIQKLKVQSQRPPQPTHGGARTPEQEAARDFVYQWGNGTQQRPPPSRLPPSQPQPSQPPSQQQNLDNKQSTMTGLAHRFQTLTVSPVTQVLQQIGVQVQTNKSYQPTARLHLAPAEEQHIKSMLDSIETKAKNVHLSATLIAAMEKMQRITNEDFSAEISELKSTATNFSSSNVGQLFQGHSPYAYH